MPVVVSLIGAVLWVSPAHASPGDNLPKNADGSVKWSALTRAQLDDLVNATSKNGPHIDSSPATIAFLDNNGNGTLYSSGVTVGWPSGTIQIFGELFRPDNSVAWNNTITCLSSTSCSLPDHNNDCTCAHGTWQLYVIGSRGSTSQSVRKDITV